MASRKKKRGIKRTSPSKYGEKQRWNRDGEKQWKYFHRSRERERENRLNYRGFSTKDLVAVVTGPRTRERKSTRKIDSIWCNDAGETAKWDGRAVIPLTSTIRSVPRPFAIFLNLPPLPCVEGSKGYQGNFELVGLEGVICASITVSSSFFPSYKFFSSIRREKGETFY